MGLNDPKRNKKTLDLNELKLALISSINFLPVLHICVRHDIFLQLFKRLIKFENKEKNPFVFSPFSRTSSDALQLTPQDLHQTKGLIELHIS